VIREGEEGPPEDERASEKKKKAGGDTGFLLNR